MPTSVLTRAELDDEVLDAPNVDAARPSPPRRMKRVTLFAFAAMVTALVVGNLLILAMSTWARASVSEPNAPEVYGIKNLRAVDDRVVRGAAPGPDGYRSLAAAGITTVVDLRAEENLNIDEQLLEELSIERIALPIRDGQTPTTADVEQFLDIVTRAEGKVFVHCGAGVGRTGAMAGAYLVSEGMTTKDALLRNLAVGPPSLEQVAYVSELDSGEFDRPGPVVTAMSRTLDAPRRLWSRYGL